MELCRDTIEANMLTSDIGRIARTSEIVPAGDEGPDGRMYRCKSKFALPECVDSARPTAIGFMARVNIFGPNCSGN
jgi:hypothetical protein